jgi:hypothetical protein
VPNRIVGAPVGVGEWTHAGGQDPVVGCAWLLTLCCMSYAAGVLPSVQRSGIDNTGPVWLGLVATVVVLSVVWAAILVVDHAAVWVLDGRCLELST